MNLRVSRRYSLALYDASEKIQKLDRVISDAGMILDLIKTSRQLDLFFKSPIINPELKVKIVNEIFKNKIEDLSLNFILLLIKNNRENISSNIFEDFIQLTKEKKGIIDVKVKTVVQLDESEKKNISKVLENYMKKKASIDFSIDKNIIGGFTAQVGNSILDASIKRQLENLKTKFKETDVFINKNN